MLSAEGRSCATQTTPSDWPSLPAHGSSLSTVRFFEIQWFAHKPYPFSFSLPHSRRVPAPSFLVSFSSRLLPSPPLPGSELLSAQRPHQGTGHAPSARRPGRPHTVRELRVWTPGGSDPSLRAASRWVLPPKRRPPLPAVAGRIWHWWSQTPFVRCWHAKLH
ncbi:hypothetical protein VPH35_088235 [Triticum aestivum]